jgi:hypothetical protein
VNLEVQQCSNMQHDDVKNEAAVADDVSQMIPKAAAMPVAMLS